MERQWITNGSKHPFYARKEIVLPKAVATASASVCGLGQFHFYINGQKVGDHELDPGWTNYNKIVQYVVFDVSSLLRRGHNVLGVEVGNGWFLKDDTGYTFSFPPLMPPNPNPYRPYGKFLMLALRMHVMYADGTEEIFTSDDTFRMKDHPVTHSNVYGSEVIDGRLRQDGWCQTEFDDRTWQPAILVPEEDAPRGRQIPQTQPPVKVVRTYTGTPIGSIVSAAGVPRTIYDFGQNISGILEVELKGHRGDPVKFYPAEKLAENGDVDPMAKQWTLVDTCITCIPGKDDAWETFRMKFTYLAGRYIAKEGPAEIRKLRVHAITSAYETTGQFICGDDRYNKIYQMIERTVEANMLSVHTDCPTIERFAWQEPNHLMAPSIMYMKDGRKLWEKFLLDMRAEQLTAEDFFLDRDGNRFCPGAGLMPAQCPCYIPNVLPVPNMGSFYDIIPWGSTCILGTYWHYWFYGDTGVIEDNYQAGMRYWKYLKTKVNSEGFICHGLGDWGNPRGAFARENIETAFLYADTTVLAWFASILGETEDRVRLEMYAEKIKENYNQKLLVHHPEEKLWCYRAWDHPNEIFYTPACQALPLYWGLVPEEKEADVVQAFRGALERDGAFVSGEIGLPYIIQTARKYGMNDFIARFVLRREHPSYYAFILDGETTLGEYWEHNPRSHCHDMMGHIVEWYYNGIAGILSEEPGFRKVTIRPYLPDSMRSFTCGFRSVHGEIRVYVCEEADAIRLKVDIPDEIDYRIDTRNLENYGKRIIIL